MDNFFIVPALTVCNIWLYLFGFVINDWKVSFVEESPIALQEKNCKLLSLTANLIPYSTVWLTL